MRRLSAVAGAVALTLVSGCQAATSDTGGRPPEKTRPAASPSARVPASPEAREWPGPDTTGVPPGTPLRPSGSIRVTREGTVIDGLDVHGEISVEADDVTIRNTRVRGIPGWWGILQRQGFSGLTVQDVEIFGNGRERTQFGILNQGGMITVRRADIHTISNGISTEQGLIEDCYVHDPKLYKGDHIDMIMSSGPPAPGTQLIIRHNTAVNTLDQTGAISLFQDFGVVHDVTVQDNLLAGGGWSLYAGAGVKGTSSNVKVIGNVFSRKVWPKGGQAGPVAYWDAHGPGNVWQGNKWDDGRPVKPD
ncbi:right-handed parallel beta-helix repeat-containing protein [Microbispora sp. ATCC PTA-5024]|uniref:right-handed parallel beta-helix repeat-containing protein n=1 Tax=Microbispora sp. ATCC PTA-5024 TaxID=316330 RepID=UPI0003DB822E|nr:right-handed parallel beta-helix repeat-containing protein [Microbispora sp. ATCC PTA-5024]ETK34338.1 hypothetical protein MPTA5024_20160 [Microbispora sp. ATCC PTA-5024]